MKTFILGRTIEELNRLVPQRQIKTIKLGENRICLSRNENSFFAFELLCPHRKADLSRGKISVNDEIICPLHEYRFDLKTGIVKNAQCQDLTIYRTELTEKGLKIMI
ncbi:Rieske (2Fe-2S) protein [Shivajiella indica]|uniref:Rieske (2Fe-2S) protein n=1 Tax=Shivajiella indica TaxID=872115 RepID=A0ABW5B9X0_9BACT